MELYCKYPEQEEDCENFRRIVSEYPQIKFYQPSPQKAPWHWQARLDCPTGEPVVLNFWPHTGKVQPHFGGPPDEGYEAHVSAINAALDYVLTAQMTQDEYSLIED